MDQVIKNLADHYAPFAEKVEQVGGKFSSADEAIKAMNDSLREQMEIIRGYRNMDIGKEITSAVESYNKAVEQLKEAQEGGTLRSFFFSAAKASGYQDVNKMTEDEMKDLVENIRSALG